MKFTEGQLELFVSKIDEPGNGQLRIVVAEGVLDEVEPIKFDDIDLGKGRPVQVTEESRFIETYWAHYVAYVEEEEAINA